MNECKRCKNYMPEKELYIGKCKATERPTMMNDTCGCFEQKEEREREE